MRPSLGSVVLLALAVTAGARAADWWPAGSTDPFPAQADYPNAQGSLRVVAEGGPVETAGHPFFRALGSNGRACVTCHQPADGMSLSAASAAARWEQYGAADPLFAATDGSNCPDLPQDGKDTHSLLIEKGLIRVARRWPPADIDGHPIKPDFEIAVVRDPTGCNLSPRWGLKSPHPAVSVFRRPRMVANLKYVQAIGFNYDPKSGLPLPIDPDTGKPSSHNLMADGRFLGLEAQMNDAAGGHLQMLEQLSPEDRRRLADFETRVYAAQQTDVLGGSVDAAGAKGGPRTLAESPAGRLGSRGVTVWSEFDPWLKPADAAGDKEEQFRASVARGAKIFRERTFLITDSRGINSPIGFGNPVRNSCVFCHNMSRIGMDVAPGQVDLGTTTMPFADPQPDLPLFRITCKGEPHPYYGKEILTHDPGYALTTGRCADVGRITLQSLRGLSARAPYFSNGAAKDLGAIVDYYNRRYNIGYTPQERQDLINLLSVL